MYSDLDPGLALNTRIPPSIFRGGYSLSTPQAGFYPGQHARLHEDPGEKISYAAGA